MSIKIKALFPALVSIWSNSAVFKQIDQFISHRARKKLMNDNFTILCSNCIGGIIYHRLGKQFLSPTINMFIKEPDFVEFCLHLEYYLSQELHFSVSDSPYPIGQLYGNGEEIPNIYLHFNHDKDPATANSNWNKRKKRINKDNLFIMLYNLSGVTREQLKQIEAVPCRNRVVFTHVPLPDIDWSFYIKPVMFHKDPYNYLEKDLFGVRYFEKKFNYIGFLNTDNIQR